MRGRITPDTLVEAYCRGVFPMADEHGVLGWYTADPRGVIPLDSFRIPRRVAAGLPKADIRVDTCFERVMRLCSECRPVSWITDEIIASYVELARADSAHSVEVFHGDKLVGGLYGVSLGGAFFGESMFHLETGASKLALAFLLGRLRERDYLLLDTQMITPVVASFGGVEIPRKDYLARLKRALAARRSFA